MAHEEKERIEAQQKEIAALEARLNACALVVTYTPLPGEVAFSDILQLTAPQHALPPSAALDPFEAAKELAARVQGADAAILLPGRMFDARGTRVGRGGGWYDRFLATVPASWLRVGFCPPERFSEVPLPRNQWDQSVDVLVIADPEGVRIIETGVRPDAVPAHLLS